MYLESHSAIFSCNLYMHSLFCCAEYPQSCRRVYLKTLTVMTITGTTQGL